MTARQTPYERLNLALVPYGTAEQMVHFASSLDRPCAIFGAGSSGLTMYKHLSQAGVEVALFIDNNDSLAGNRFEGLPVSTPLRLGRAGLAAQPIFLASVYSEEIAAQLVRDYQLEAYRHFFELDPHFLCLLQQEPLTKPAFTEPPNQNFKPVLTQTDFLMICWGETFTRNFLEYALPCLLSAGNLPAWPFADTACFALYAPEQDWRLMEQHPALKRLSEIMRVEWRPIQRPKPGDNKYNHMNQWTADAFNRAQDRSAGVVILAPDAFWSDGSFAHLAGLVKAGRDMVMLCGWHVDEEHMLPGPLRDPQTQAITLTRQDCLHYINNLMHADTRARFWDGTHFMTCCSNIYRRLPDGGIEARCYHLHPIYLRYPRRNVDFAAMPVGTFDGDYMMFHWEERQNCAFIDDSSMIAFNWQPEQELEAIGRVYNEAQRELLREAFHARIARPIHHFFYEHPLILK